MNTYLDEILPFVKDLEDKGRYSMLKDFYQHGNTTVYSHCLDVAAKSLYLADEYKANIDRKSLIYGALLHDYFLYDWHDTPKEYGLHGFTHPMTAMKNARQDYDIDAKTAWIIRTHMFPLVPIAPKSKEGWIVCIADKMCASHETIAPYLVMLRRALQ